MIERRLGLLVPSANTVLEEEARWLVPDCITIHAARIRQRQLSPEALKQMEAEAVSAATLLADAQVGCLLYGITAPSFLLGPDHDLELVARIEDATGIPSLTVAQGILAELRNRNAKQVALATPYPEAATQREIAFLNNFGFEVTGWSALGLSDVAEIGRLKSETVLQAAELALARPADILLVSCTNWASSASVAELERRFGLPVITSNTAGIAVACELLAGERPQPAGSG